MRIFFLVLAFFLFNFLFLYTVASAQAQIEILKGEVQLESQKIIYKTPHLKINLPNTDWDIQAKEVIYFLENNKMFIKQGQIKDEFLKISAEKIVLDANTGFVEISNGEILDTKNGIKIEGEFIQQQQKNQYEVKKGFFTSCILNKKKMHETWKIYAKQMNYYVENYAFTNGGLFYLFDLPIFYLPYFGFPTTTKRKSGFLYPETTYQETSGQSGYGLQFKLPYFWALGEYTNLTLGLDILSKRGIGLEYDFEQAGKNKQKIKIDGWYLQESFLERKTETESFLPRRFYNNFFYYFGINKNSDLFLDSFIASDSQLNNDYNINLTKPRQVAREQKIFLDHRWKNFLIYTQILEIEEFADLSRNKPNYRLDTPDWGKLHLERYTNNKLFNGSIFRDFEQFSRKQGWNGTRTNTAFKGNILLQNRFLFFQPNFTYLHRSYQANLQDTYNQNINNRDFFYNFFNWGLKSGLNLEKQAKKSRFFFQSAIKYQNTPKVNALKSFSQNIEAGDTALDLISQQPTEPLFDEQDFILPQNNIQLTLTLQQEKNNNEPFLLELSRVYNFLAQDTTAEHINYLVIPTKYKENSFSATQYWMPWHLKLNWNPTPDFFFFYSARHDSVAKRTLEQNWKFSYKGWELDSRNNTQNYTSYQKENFFQTRELFLLINYKITNRWKGYIQTKKNYLIPEIEAESTFLGRNIDDINLSFQYQDCCSKFSFLFFEKYNSDREISRGVKLNFDLISGF